MLANSGDLDQMPRSAVSDLCLYCLPMPHKKTPGLYGLKPNGFSHHHIGKSIIRVGSGIISFQIYFESKLL